ncbi:sporulation protein [Longimycelium tulufanense]|uniref:Sporulation protein n=1 Tax=Longimycelium tulufanense TaxID=907463 RepID=A0A8J3CGD0_9PSEU|nr:sporulation protein [Longimycelium tulufanense]GGM63050.1 sporulation protein [Longimycelium tulufanense]
MVFKKMLKTLGIGGPKVDTVLADPTCRPGTSLTGEVRLVGGEADAAIEHIALSLVTRVERGERPGNVEFHRVAVFGPLRLAAKEQRAIPFQLPIPWEAPITMVSGQQLPGMTLGVRTELAIAKAVDKGDLDPVQIIPLPSQDRVLDAFGQLGFQFKSSDLEPGRLYGVAQQLPFFQELEFFPPAQYAGLVNEVELTFVATPASLDVILEADKRAGFAQPGGEAFGRIHVSHDEAMTVDWAGQISAWLDQVVAHRGTGVPGGHPGMPAGMYGHPEQRRRGPGVGGVVAGAAAGFVGGMIAGEAMDEVGEAFLGDDEES